MGNLPQNRWDHGKMSIALDNRHIEAGHEVSGVVSLIIEKPLRVYSVVCKVQGKDESRLEESDGSELRVLEKKRVHFEEEVTLADYGGEELEPGEYSFPFKIVIPKDVPPSVSCSLWGKDLYFRLRYFVKAQVNAVDTSMVVSKQGKSSLRCREFITVSVHQVPYKPMHDFKIPIQKKVGLTEKLCEGSIIMNKNFFLPGEDVRFKISLDNSHSGNPCELKIKYVCKG
jgi:hypothetical protein